MNKTTAPQHNISVEKHSKEASCVTPALPGITWLYDLVLCLEGKELPELAFLLLWVELWVTHITHWQNFEVLSHSIQTSTQCCYFLHTQRRNNFGRSFYLTPRGATVPPLTGSVPRSTAVQPVSFCQSNTDNLKTGCDQKALFWYFPKDNNNNQQCIKETL